MPNYARFFQNLSSKHSKKLNSLKYVAAGTALAAYPYVYLQAEKRYAQAFFTNYLDTTLIRPKGHLLPLTREKEVHKTITEANHPASRFLGL